MSVRIHLAIAAAVLAAFAGSARADETLCGTRESVLKQLAAEYQEAPIGVGLATNGAMVELLTSAEGTWTLIVTQPKGATCLLGTGDAWQTLARKVGLKDRTS